MAEYPESDDDGAPAKKKKKKDPNAPKKNLNAWMFFIQQVRPQVMIELGEEGKRVAAVTKAVAERWSKMTPEEKAVRVHTLSFTSSTPFSLHTMFLSLPQPQIQF